MCGDSTQAAIERLVSKYAESIDSADEDLAAEVWATTGDISFIHPRGHEHGWDEVRRNFYSATMRDSFSQRRLLVHDLAIRQYDEMAIAEFYWDFAATLRADGSALETHGRETQVFRHAGGRWQLVHVHYSAMPVTGTREGF